MSLTIRPARVAVALLVVVAVFTGLSVLSLYLRFGLGHETVAGLDLVGIFHLDADVSVPGWSSASALAAAALIIAVIAAITRARGERYWRHWAGLAVILCYLSVDETARLHEQSAQVMVVLFEQQSFLTRSWTVPATVAALVFAASYLRFLGHLEARQRLLFLAAGSMFVLGAVGMEVLGHYVVRPRLPTSDYGVVPYQTVVHLEELLEMTAIVLLIHAALRELQSRTGMLRIQIVSRT